MPAGLGFSRIQFILTFSWSNRFQITFYILNNKSDVSEINFENTIFVIQNWTKMCQKQSKNSSTITSAKSFGVIGKLFVVVTSKMSLFRRFYRRSLAIGGTVWPFDWFGFDQTRTQNGCSLNLSKAAESKQNKQELSGTATLLLKLMFRRFYQLNCWTKHYLT